MSDERARKYRIIAGDVPRVIRGIEARKKISRELHGLVVMQPTPRHFADWWFDLRRGQLRIYGGLLRFIDVSVMQGVSRATLQQIPQWLSAYIDEQFEGRSSTKPRRAA